MNTATLSPVLDAPVNGAVAADRDGFGEAFDIRRDGKGNLVMGGAADKRRNQNAMEELNSVTRVGVQPVVIFNMLPWPIRREMGYLGLKEIPAPDSPEGRASLDQLGLPEFTREYAGKVALLIVRGAGIDTPMDPGDQGDAKYIIKAVAPSDIGADFDKEYGPFGGVCWQRFIQNSDEQYTAPLERIKEKLADAGKRMKPYMLFCYREAESQWRKSEGNPKVISDSHVAAAKHLFDIGEIRVMPEWASATRSANAQFKECFFCASNILQRARICATCQNVQPGFEAEVAEAMVLAGGGELAGPKVKGKKKPEASE